MYGEVPLLLPVRTAGCRGIFVCRVYVEQNQSFTNRKIFDAADL